MTRADLLSRVSRTGSCAHSRHSFVITVAQARDYYTMYGIETIPLLGKHPIADAWQTIPPDQQWCKVRRIADVNIGLRHGNGPINIECDERKIAGTFDRVMAGLSGLGVTNPVIIQSASRIGRHVYLYCGDRPSEASYRNLSRDIGAGELRFGSGAMSVLPPSAVDGTVYQLIDGAWESLPDMQWRDLLWLLPAQCIFTPQESLPIRLIWRPMTPAIVNLFEAIAKADRGESVGRYLSRSEAEAAIVAQLVLNGWTFPEIRGEFRQRECGHYAEMKRHKDRYLANTYANALGVIVDSPVRRALAVDYQAAELKAWPGRSGNSDQAAYLALLSECYRAATLETSVSVREIAEHAALGHSTAQRALNRLAGQRLIERVQGAAEDGRIAAVYRVIGDNGTSITSINTVPESARKLTSVPLSTYPELAARDVLGKSAVNVYRYLDVCEARSVKELMQLTGRARSTVRAALERLCKYHLAIETDSGAWIMGTNDLESVAVDFACDALAAARREKHAQDRARYRAYVTARKSEGEI